MKSFQLSVKAKSDLTDIALFTQRRWGKEKRNSYIKQLDQAFRLLAEKPDIGIACDYVRSGYRKFPQGSHLIFYKQETKQSIQIIRILHKSMDVTSIVTERK